MPHYITCLGPCFGGRSIYINFAQDTLILDKAIIEVYLSMHRSGPTNSPLQLAWLGLFDSLERLVILGDRDRVEAEAILSFRNLKVVLYADEDAEGCEYLSNMASRSLERMKFRWKFSDE